MGSAAAIEKNLAAADSFQTGWISLQIGEKVAELLFTEKLLRESFLIKRLTGESIEVLILTKMI